MDLHWMSKFCVDEEIDVKEDLNNVNKTIIENRKAIKALFLMILPNYIRENGVGFFESLPKYKSLRGFPKNINPFTWINQCNSKKNFYSYYANENPIVSHDTAKSLEFKKESKLHFETNGNFDEMFFFAASIKFTDKNVTVFTFSKESYKNVVKVKLSTSKVYLEIFGDTLFFEKIDNYFDKWIFIGFKLYSNGTYELYVNDYKPIVSGRIYINSEHIKKIRWLTIGDGFVGKLNTVILFSEQSSDKNFSLLSKNYQNAIFSYLNDHTKF